MADVQIETTLRIEAETVGDLSKFLQALEQEDVKLSTPLISAVTVAVQVERPVDKT